METETNQTKPATIRVVATTGGFKTFVAFLAAMFIFLIVFLVGIIAGVSGFAAAIDNDSVVQQLVEHDGDDQARYQDRGEKKRFGHAG